MSPVEQIIRGLHAAPPERLSFAPELCIRAFLVQRDSSNLLIYSTGAVTAVAREIEALGGVARHYLNHAHEAGMGCAEIGRAFGAPLVCHEKDRPAVERQCAVAETFAERHAPDDDFEVIPIPGHTPGATAYVWDSGEHRCLFTGDSIYLGDGGDWVGGLIASSDPEAFAESMALLRDVDFDTLVPWAAIEGAPAHAFTGRADARRRIDAIIDGARRGDAGRR